MQSVTNSAMIASAACAVVIAPRYGACPGEACSIDCFLIEHFLVGESCVLCRALVSHIMRDSLWLFDEVAGLCMFNDCSPLCPSLRERQDFETSVNQRPVSDSMRFGK